MDTAGGAQHLLELRVVLLGWSRAGKSSAGNTILGCDIFELARRTPQCESLYREVAGRKVTVVDTFGWKESSARDTPEEEKQELVNSVTLYGHGPHAILLVIPIDIPITEEYRRAVEEHLELLNVRVWRHTVILFTFGDCLRGQTIHQHIEGEGAALQWLVGKCGNRYHVLNNKKRKDRTQVTELLEKIEQMVAGNGGCRFKMDGGDPEKMKEHASTDEDQAKQGLQTDTTERELGREHFVSELRVVLLGWRNTGKSSAGNTILGRKEFGASSKHHTRREGIVAGRKIIVVDTPGWQRKPILNTSEHYKQNIVHSVYMCPPGPHALFLVVELFSAFTEAQRKSLEEHLELLSKRAWKHVMVLFTGGDRLQDATIKQHISNQGEALQWLVQKCGNRYHVLNNKNRNDWSQVTKLLERTVEMVAENNGGHYELDSRVSQETEEERILVVERAQLRLMKVKTERERIQAHFKEAHKRAVEDHMEVFSERVWRYTMVLFTKGDWLKDTTIEQHIEIEGEALQWLVEKCGNPYHVFNNLDHGNGSQVTELLEKIEEIVAGNSGRYFSSVRFLEGGEKSRSREQAMKGTVSGGSKAPSSLAESCELEQEGACAKVNDWLKSSESSGYSSLNSASDRVSIEGTEFWKEDKDEEEEKGGARWEKESAEKINEELKVAVREEEDPQVFEPDPQFLNFDPGSGEQVKMLKQGRDALNYEKWQLKEHIKLLQQILHLNELYQDSNNTGQQKLDSENHESEARMKEALRIQKHKMQEMERQHLKTEALLNTKIALEEKRVQENWINTCVAERALEAERKETASLREQLMEALTKLAHIRSPVFLPATVSFDQQMTDHSKDGSAMQTSSGSALDESENTTFLSVSDEVDQYKKKLQASENMVQQLEEHIQKLECDKASLHSQKQYMDNLIAIMQEKLAIMDDLCQQKDNALQEKLAQEQLEQHEKDIRAAGPKEEIRAFKQRIQEIEGKHHKTEADLQSKIEFHKKQAEQNRISTLVSERALLLERRETESLRKKLVEVSAKLAGYQGLLCEPTASCSAQQIPPARKGVTKKSDLGELTNSTPEALEKEHNSFMKKLLAEECELQQLQEENSTSTLEQERATSKDKCHLKMQIKSLQHKLNKMKEMFQ
ncbi:uncharacterized protein LOC118770011 [Megalops cyprinoides]|uniref:uncharacterized protein LOC118770011 n=1 Tax=Megalops cyprinoides TaxID=118141 RepID=UPI001863A53C|nr:uncharacterized protein LOC118770011 [Megalops cyprinoides]